MILNEQISQKARAHTSEVRFRFQQWLRANREAAQRLTLRKLLWVYGQAIPIATAYRVAMAEGLRGNRQNSSRYGDFWERVNWAIPDRVLCRIWGVSRQTLRHRRLRLRVGPAIYDPYRLENQSTYRTAFAMETRKALRYAGPRPH